MFTTDMGWQNGAELDKVVVLPEGSDTAHEAYEISKSRDFEPDFLISNLISVDF